MLKYEITEVFVYCTLIQGCEKEVREAASEEQKGDSVMRLSWALIHSKDQADVNRGIAMVEGVLLSVVLLLFVMLCVN